VETQARFVFDPNASRLAAQAFASASVAVGAHNPIHQRDVLVARVIINTYKDHVRSFLPSQWFSTNHTALGSKEPMLLRNQVPKNPSLPKLPRPLVCRNR
jgi:hypothetical protein